MGRPFGKRISELDTYAMAAQRLRVASTPSVTGIVSLPGQSKVFLELVPASLKRMGFSSKPPMSGSYPKTFQHR
eukprot:3711393-Alexandrium_andersonii.AAC.1